MKKMPYKFSLYYRSNNEIVFDQINQLYTEHIESFNETINAHNDNLGQLDTSLINSIGNEIISDNLVIFELEITHNIIKNFLMFFLDRLTENYEDLSLCLTLLQEIPEIINVQEDIEELNPIVFEYTV
ncbi:hypothetical protein [Taibaiella sp. KBW10]|uniref:hypothetical protein n=1 Tax=Taibaiella sp. KBW10 TaxID=2153357 RepID=UPI000F59E8C0|nr:hypothetical protein [Taibaiella sp. KBW10]